MSSRVSRSAFRRSPRLLFCGVGPAWPLRWRDQGLEVVWLPTSTPERLVAAAEQEDVAALAVDDAELGARVAGALGDVVVFSVTSPDRPSSSQERQD